MKLLKHRGKILKHVHRVIRKHNNMGGSINHLLHHSHHTGGNISELKRQLKHLVIKPKKSHKIKF